MNDSRPTRRLSADYLWAAAGVLASLYLILVVALGWRQYQWDFSVYYSAAHATRVGLDPYRLADIQTFQTSTFYNHLDWLYPPLILQVFRPFTHLPYHAAVEVWLGLKVLGIGLLLSLWHRTIYPLRCDAFSLAFFAFAFNAALVWDVSSGNASALEALGIWCALVCWIRRRYLAFGLTLALIAQMKFLPIVFLALLFVPTEAENGPPRGKALLILLVSLAAFLAPLLFYAERYGLWTREFLRILQAQDTGAPNNASLLVFFRNLLSAFGLPSGASRIGSLAFYAVTAGVALLVTYRALQARLRQVRTNGQASPASEKANRVSVALLAVATYAFLAPRMLFYTPVLALIPAYAAFRPAFDRLRGDGSAPMTFGVPAAALVLALAPINLPPPLNQLFWLNYSRLAALGLIWWLHCRAMRQA